MHQDHQSGNWSPEANGEFFPFIWAVVPCLAVVFFHVLFDLNNLLPLALLAAIFVSWAMLYRRSTDRERTRVVLLERFGARYDAMSSELNRAIKSADAGTLSEDDELVLIRYFSLCAQVWLAWSSGYAGDPMWASWANGMKRCSSDRAIMALWSREKATGVYYGFDLANPVPKPKASIFDRRHSVFDQAAH